MPIEIKMPALSPTMTEGNLAVWNKKEGDKITPGDIVAEIETDKATMEIEAVDEGVLGKIIIPAGTENVKVNEVIAVLLEEGEDSSAIDNYQAAPQHTSQAAQQTNKESDSTIIASKTTAENSLQIQNLPNYEQNNNQNRIFASPLAKKIAQEKNINLQMVVGTGPHGRIVKKDVLSYVAPVAGIIQRHHCETTSIPNNHIRKIIAKKLLESKNTIPHFYLSIECDIDNLTQARIVLNEHEKVKFGQDADNKMVPKLSVNDFVIKAVALAMKDVPEANSSWTDEAIIRYNNIDISVAVAIDGGLITPVIRNADQKNLFTISNEMKILAKKAREGKLLPEEFQGGGFSISNLGMYGIKNFSAIINPPQAAILAVGASEKKLFMTDSGNVISKNIMSVTLSCDHRVVDGAVGAKFLSSFKKYIENPILVV